MTAETWAAVYSYGIAFSLGTASGVALSFFAMWIGRVSR